MTKGILTTIICLTGAQCAAGAVKVSCANGNNAVAVGQSITCTASSPVTWTLNGQGSLSNANQSSVTYTAPKSIRPQNQLYGCPVLPNDTVYNTRIDALPLAVQSPGWIANVGRKGINFIGSWGHSYADITTPTGPIKVYYGSTQVSPKFVLPVTPFLKRENGAFRSHWDNNDHHQLAVRVSDCTFWEVYNTYTNDLSPTGNCQDRSPGCNATGAIYYSWSNYARTGGTDAASLPLAPLTLHLHDIKAASVNHALRFTSCLGCIYHGTFLWPALSANGCTRGGKNVNGVDCDQSPPMGARFRLRVCNGSSVTSNCIEAAKYSKYAQAVIKGLHEYGMFLSDIGGMNQITVDSDISNDPTAETALREITGIPMSDFEVVDESSLVINENSIRVNPANHFVKPLDAAVVIATTARGATVETPIAVEPVSLGLNSTNLFVLAGDYSFQIPYWIVGSQNENATWSLVSGLGSVSAAGVYTPPATVNGTAEAIVKGTSAADQTAVSYVSIHLLPSGGKPAGGIRIDSGGGGVTDREGNVWLPDQGYEAGAYVLLGHDTAWTNDNAGANPEIAVYESAGYTYGSDLVYNFVVPNGNYKIRFMVGQPYNGWPKTKTKVSPVYHGRQDLEAQGQIGLHNFNMLQNQPEGWKGFVGVPSDAYVPARVTDHLLEIAVRGVYFQADNANYGTNCSSCMTPQLNGLQVIPDSSQPQWTIDTQQITSLSTGASVQLYVVDWYSGISDAKWSVASGPGSVSATGLYTAPKAQSSGPQTVVILAQSASKPSLKATATLTIAAAGAK